MKIIECKNCGSERVEIRKQILNNGAAQYWYQCLSCGEKCGSALKHEFVRKQLGSLDKADLFDQYLLEVKQREYWDKRQREAQSRQADYQLEKAAQDAIWWAQYNEYLTTEKWRDKRRRVLERDDYMCQACLKRHATDVHHLTYERVFNEPLFDLVSVCTPCHEELHPHMKEGKRHEI